MAEEVWFFGRNALFALVVSGIYWVASYEVVGTVLLFGFGVANAVAFSLLRRGERQGRAARAGQAGGSTTEPGQGPDGPFGDETGPVPTRSAAPLMVGLGIGVAALGAAFGPWLVLAGLLPLLVGATDWLGAANHELDQRVRADAAKAAGPRVGRGDD
jgi:prepilin signal peptidase PulO-like enzyme (type II secretory pathway)